ncbi:hypothetical protein AO726_00230 [Pseudomonas sp. TTU2014-080ASC]|nr:hypothetical protein AO726_00230 [Pseudomonas sp. TTU2014-080ASC]
MLVSLFEWFMINPARFMVAISVCFSFIIIKAEYEGRRSGGSGWLVLFRMVVGSIFMLLTAVVAAFFGGIGAFFGYLFLQLMVCIVIPALVVEAI